MNVFWNVALCSLVDVYRREQLKYSFGRTINLTKTQAVFIFTLPSSVTLFGQHGVIPVGVISGLALIFPGDKNLCNQSLLLPYYNPKITVLQNKFPCASDITIKPEDTSPTLRASQETILGYGCSSQLLYFRWEFLFVFIPYAKAVAPCTSRIIA